MVNPEFWVVWIFGNFVDEKIDDPVDLQMGIGQAASKAVPARPLCVKADPGLVCGGQGSSWFKFWSNSWFRNQSNS